MSNIDESVLRHRVSGLSGLGLAEEQRTRKSMASLLSRQQDHVDPEPCTEQLEVQAIRLGISILRHQTDQLHMARDTAKMQSALLSVREDTARLAAEADQWRKRNEVFQTYEALGDKILAAGPPIPELQSQISSIEHDIDAIGRQIDEEREVLAEEATRLTAIATSPRFVSHLMSVRSPTSVVLEEPEEAPVAAQHPVPPNILPPGRHRLHAGRGVRFHPSVVDNEHLGHRKSNVCCIFRTDPHQHCDHTKNNYERI